MYLTQDMPWYNRNNVESGVKHQYFYKSLFVDVNVKMMFIATFNSLTAISRCIYIYIYTSIIHPSVESSLFWFVMVSPQPWVPKRESCTSGMCRAGLACADYAGWSGSIHYAEIVFKVFRMTRPVKWGKNSSYVKINLIVVFVFDQYKT